ncbi:MAG: hypothetical protein WD066_07075 [Planctomycetaceae bacterium]
MIALRITGRIRNDGDSFRIESRATGIAFFTTFIAGILSVRRTRSVGSAAILLWISSAVGQGADPDRYPTFSQIVLEADCAVVAARVRGAGPRVSQVVRILRGNQHAIVGQQIRIDEFPLRDTVVRESESDGRDDGIRYLLVGKRDRDGLEWSMWHAVSNTIVEYIEKLPGLDMPRLERLKHFAPFVGSNDLMIDADALVELYSADWADLVAISGSLPRARLRELIERDERRADVGDFIGGIYGPLLAACGRSEDAEFLKARTFGDPGSPGSADFGLTLGYLLLSGEEGLALIEEAKVKPRYVDVVLPDGTIRRQNAVPFRDSYPAMRVIRCLRDHGNGKITEERLRRSMRLFLEHPQLTAAAIHTLSSWKDWSIQERLIALHIDESAPMDVKKAVIAYFVKCIADAPPGAGALPEHVVRARTHLETLRKRDPEGVATAEAGYAETKRLAALRKDAPRTKRLVSLFLR